MKKMTNAAVARVYKGICISTLAKKASDWALNGTKTKTLWKQQQETTKNL